jgi:flagellar hook assembly protein FlgD
MSVTVSLSTAVSVVVTVKNKDTVGVPSTVAITVEAASSSLLVDATTVGAAGAVVSSSTGITSSDVGRGDRLDDNGAPP